MKRIMSMSIAALLLCAAVHPASGAGDREQKSSIAISGAWAMYPTVVAWAEAFQKSHPQARIDVSAGGAGKGAAEAIAGLVDIGMVSREPDPAELEKGITPIYILHDAVFPVISNKNAARGDILKTGIRRDAWIGMYASGAVGSWDDVVATKTGAKIHVYTRSDACGAAASWAAYLGKKQDDLKGIGVYGDPGLLQAAIRDPLGVGYCNFSYVFTREGGVVEGALLVPIDANGNGIADADEVFKNRSQAIDAIRKGRYPATRKNYFYVKGAPRGPVKEFIEFALSEEGTKIVDETGTSLPLEKPEREEVLEGMR